MRAQPALWHTTAVFPKRYRGFTSFAARRYRRSDRSASGPSCAMHRRVRGPQSAASPLAGNQLRLSAVHLSLLPRGHTSRPQSQSCVTNRLAHSRISLQFQRQPTGLGRTQRGCAAAVVASDANLAKQLQRASGDNDSRKHVLVLGGTGRVGSSTAASLLQVTGICCPLA